MLVPLFVIAGYPYSRKEVTPPPDKRTGDILGRPSKTIFVARPMEIFQKLP